MKKSLRKLKYYLVYVLCVCVHKSFLNVKFFRHLFKKKEIICKSNLEFVFTVVTVTLEKVKPKQTDNKIY